MRLAPGAEDTFSHERDRDAAQAASLIDGDRERRAVSVRQKHPARTEPRDPSRAPIHLSFDIQKPSPEMAQSLHFHETRHFIFDKYRYNFPY